MTVRSKETGREYKVVDIGTEVKWAVIGCGEFTEEEFCESFEFVDQRGIVTPMPMRKETCDAKSQE